MQLPQPESGSGRFAARPVPDEVARVRRDRFGELRADVDVHCEIAGAQAFEGILDSFAGFQLSNATVRHETGRRLQAKARVSSAELDLSALIDEPHLRVRRAVLDGEAPSICLTCRGRRLMTSTPSMDYAF